MKHIVLLVPAVLITVSVFLLETEIGLLMFAIPYVLTIAGIVVVIKRKLCNVWRLPISFLLSPLPIVFFDAVLNHGSCMQWLATLLVTMGYSLPFTIISLIIAAILSRKQGALSG